MLYACLLDPVEGPLCLERARIHDWRALVRLLCVMVAATATAACASEAPAMSNEAPSHLESPDACIDRDGDGFGSGCSLGFDCDDHDPTVASECGGLLQRQPCEGSATRSCF